MLEERLLYGFVANLSRLYWNDFAGALLGPIPGMLTGPIQVDKRVTTDIFHCIIHPIQILTGLLAVD